MNRDISVTIAELLLRELLPIRTGGMHQIGLGGTQFFPPFSVSSLVANPFGPAGPLISWPKNG